MNPSRILAYVYETPWAILPATLATICEIAHRHARGEKLSAEEVAARVNGKAGRPGAIVGDIAVIPLYGAIVPRSNMMTEHSGATSAEAFGNQFKQLVNDASIGAIVIDTDSPGGSVQGIDELAQTIYAARGVKPVIAVANHLAASAAYWIATAADELVMTPSAEVGSIGVFAAHDDMSKACEQAGVKTTLISAGKYKTEGSPYEPLTEESRASIQERVNEYYSMFTAAVARNRGTSQNDVKSGYGEGRVVGAKQAVKLGMADRVDTLEGVISRLAKRKPVATRNAAADLDFRQRRARALTY